MFKRILVCPGQGKFDAKSLEYLAQHAKEPLMQKLLDQTDQILPELRLSKYIVTPHDTPELDRTSIQQPLLILTSYLKSELFRQKHGRNLIGEADYMLGHSLGEISALVLQGVLGFEQGLKAGHRRGQLMEEIVKDDGREFGMYALLFQPQQFDVIVRMLKEQELNIANYNTYSQVVVSGPKKELQQKIKCLQQQLIKYKVWKTRVRPIDLQVHVPFHHPILSPIKPELLKILGDTEMTQMPVPNVSNLDAAITSNTKVQVTKIVEVTSHPVLFTKCLEHFTWKDAAAYEFINYGAATQGLVRRFYGDFPKLHRSDRQPRFRNVTIDELISGTDGEVEA